MEEPKQPLPQFRRKLDDNTHAVPVREVTAEKQLPPLWMMAIAVIGGIWLLFSVYQHLAASKIDSELLAEQRAHSYITVYAPTDSPAAQFMNQLAAIYGLQVDLKPVIGDTLKIGLRNGKIVEGTEFFSLLHNLPIVNFHPGAPAGTIYLYGVQGCPYAQRARDMLKAKGIPFVDVDLNNESDPAMTGFDARLVASGFGMGEGTRNPYLEYNNRIYQNPDLYQVIDHLK